MRILKGRAASYFALGLILLIFFAMIADAIIFSGIDKSTDIRTVVVNGKYSLDGGEWQDTIPDKMVDSPYHTLTIKGALPLLETTKQELLVFADNIWFEFDTKYTTVNNGEHTDENGVMRSPGYTVTKIPLVREATKSSIDCTLTLTYPYSMFSNRDLPDFFRLYLAESADAYHLMIQEKLLPVLFCILICFFGLLAFPIAGTVLGGINMRYLAFSLLCFFTGFHLLGQMLYRFLPLWIDSPVLCMSIYEATNHLFGISMLIFIKASLMKPEHKVICNIAVISFSVLIILLFIFNAVGVSDLYASKPVAQLYFTICASALTVCLVREFKTNRNALLTELTLIPLGLTLLFDALNMYFGFSTVMLFECGAAFMLFSQIINLIVDLHNQYRETIRYQQMQRELYESRVAIMVSQIQPHFLYNSLTSIAMMCSINPETAQEATITFADYLRGNMDSLKQTAPVPFSKELEHLKKYLYIEKLRFGDDLNVVYDIETTDFVLPQLSIQPLVENAVKHGVGMKREGGTVTIATRETDKAFEVIISDDGVGFDTEATKNDGRSHIGMDNVRRRLDEMCAGSVKIESIIGIGTVATVTLPKEGQHHENTLR